MWWALQGTAQGTTPAPHGSSCCFTGLLLPSPVFLFSISGVLCPFFVVCSLRSCQHAAGPGCTALWLLELAVPSMAQPGLSSQIPLRPQQHLGTGVQHSKVGPSPTSYHAQCAVLPGDQYCGGRLEKPSGSFQTPNWPERDYPAGVTCSWHIVAPKNQVTHCPIPPPSPAATHRGATQAALVVKIPPG